MALVADGRAADAMAIGVVAAVLDDPRASAETAVAVGGLLGATRIGAAERRAFVAAVEGMVERWVAAAESANAAGEDARRRVLAVVDRADHLAADAGLTEALHGNAFLPSAFRTRLRAVAASLGPAPDADAPTRAAAALAALREHRLAQLHPDRCAAAEMAVRLHRWLAAPSAPAGSVAAAVAAQVAEGGWVDRALTAVWAGERIDDPVVAAAYRTVFDAARHRRDDEDAAFAALLPDWVAHASASGARRSPAGRTGAGGGGCPAAGSQGCTAGGGRRRDERGGCGGAGRAARRAGVGRGVAGDRTSQRGGRDGALGHPCEPRKPADRPGLRRRPGLRGGRVHRLLAPAPAPGPARAQGRHRRSGRAQVGRAARRGPRRRTDRGGRRAQHRRRRTRPRS